MIEEFGGFFVPPDNLRNAPALRYILEFVGSPVSGGKVYVTLIEKAVAIAYHIITRHVFFDGNKRTAIHIAWEFLRSNGVRVSLDLTIVGLAEAVARGEASYQDLLAWFEEHQRVK